MKIENSDYFPPECALNIDAALRARFSEVPDDRWQELLRCLFNTSIKDSLYPEGKLLNKAINKEDTWARLLGAISISDPDRVTGLRLRIRRPKDFSEYYSVALFKPDRGESDAPGQVEAVFSLTHGKRVTSCHLRGRAPVTTGPEGQVLGVGFGLSVRTETNGGIRRLLPDPQPNGEASRNTQLSLVPYSQEPEGRPTKLAKMSMRHGSGPAYRFEISSRIFGLPFFSRGIELRAESADDHVRNGLDGFFEDALRANAGRLGVDVGKIG